MNQPGVWLDFQVRAEHGVEGLLHRAQKRIVHGDQQHAAHATAFESRFNRGAGVVLRAGGTGIDSPQQSHREFLVGADELGDIVNRGVRPADEVAQPFHVFRNRFKAEAFYDVFGRSSWQHDNKVAFVAQATFSRSGMTRPAF